MENDRFLDRARTCLNCRVSETCWAFRKEKEIVDSWPLSGFVGAGAPGQGTDLYMALANACTLFEFKKIGK